MTFYDDTIQKVQDESCFKNLQHFGSLRIKVRLIYTRVIARRQMLIFSRVIILLSLNKKNKDLASNKGSFNLKQEPT